MRRFFGLKTVVFGLACAFATVGQAQTLKIGLASEPTAVDPHYHQTTPGLFTLMKMPAFPTVSLLPPTM